MRHHHVGVACKNIEKTAQKLAPMFDAAIGRTVFDPEQNAHLCMLNVPDGSKIELVSGPVVETYLSKRVSYYHICYEVDDLHDTINTMKLKGAVVLSAPKPAILFHGRKVAFLITPIGLVELLAAI